MNQFFSALGQDLWRATWQGGLFVVAVLVSCKVFRRLPASARHLLWWLACLQMPLRLLFFSPVTLPVLPAIDTQDTAALEATSPPRSANFLGSEGTLSAPESASSGLIGLGHVPDERRQASSLAVSSQISVHDIEQSEPIPAAPVLLAGWGVGVATVLVLATRRLIRTRRLLKQSRPIFGLPQRLVAEFSAQLRVRPPSLREADPAPCPLLAGWFRPTIVFPSGFAHERNEAELRMALAHELAHLKRRDLWMAGIPLLTQTLFFFHPLAWLAIRESAAACEEACDVEAMRLSGGSPSAYARLLLSSAQSDVPIAAMGAAFGFRLLQRRITMLNQTAPLAKSGLQRGFLALLALGVACSIPWSVTAQVPAPPAVHVAPKKVVHSHKRHVTRHHAAKKPPNAKLILVAARAGVQRLGQPQTPPTPSVNLYTGLTPPPATVALPATRGRGQTVPTPPPATREMGFMSPQATRSVRGPRDTAYPPVAPAAPASVRVPSPGTPRPPTAPPTTATTPPLYQDAAGPMPTTPQSEPPTVVRVGDKEFNVEMHRTSLITALRALFKTAGVDFSIKSTVDNDSVTCTLNGAEFLTALKILLQSGRQELTYRREGTVFVIEPKYPAASGLGARD